MNTISELKPSGKIAFSAFSKHKKKTEYDKNDNTSNSYNDKPFDYYLNIAIKRLDEKDSNNAKNI